MGFWLDEEFDIAAYWERRYKKGKTSGSGSYGRLAAFKAAVLNEFVEHNAVSSIIELGCGDGSQLSLARYPQYTGFDVSETAVKICRDKFRGDPGKSFLHMSEFCNNCADLSMSLDVIYHLVNWHDFDEHMRHLFDSAERFVIIYSSNTNQLKRKSRHVLRRRFTDWTDNKKNFRMIDKIPNPYPLSFWEREGGPSDQYSASDFYIFERTNAS